MSDLPAKKKKSPPFSPLPPSHVSIIMDGNGRWATARGRPRVFGHAEGVRTLGKVIVKASGLGIKCLSVFAFSTENWSRPKNEVDFLWKLPSGYAKKATDLFNKNNVVFRWLGFDEKVPRSALKVFAGLEQKTKTNTGMTFVLVMNYGGQQDILRAFSKMAFGTGAQEDFASQMASGFLPPVDLLIRTGGEKRISNYLLWHLAYAELLFTDVLWPAYTPEHLVDNVREYWQRERRFGTISAPSQKS